ncbi:unnamed protein product [Anisakis simplex]|uniref:ZM domain-containing protein n=1 Tax=Anisakis simplex TaxID=6269 RepID=A0A0M3JJ98_ANISI|nr:unnamed protein product [Anisakis simplex]
MITYRSQPKQDYAKNNPNVQLNRNNSPTVMQYGHYGLKNDPSVENYITDAEVNTRGYKDRMGRIFYAIPLIDRTNKTAPRQQNQPQQQRKESQKAPNIAASHPNVVVTSQRYSEAIRFSNVRISSDTIVK